MVSARSAVILVLLQDGGVYAFDVTAGTKDQKQLTGKEKAKTQSNELEQNQLDTLGSMRGAERPDREMEINKCHY